MSAPRHLRALACLLAPGASTSFALPRRPPSTLRALHAASAWASALASDGASSSSFALSAVSRGIPKAETGVLSLWEGAPEADGRGVRIAVLDTGCDLAAAGLGGEAAGGGPKYLDFLDCTGDGDVECGAPVSVPSSRTVRGATGRDLALGPWAPSEVRLGAVRLYDLVPRSVRARLQRERGEIFEGEHRLLLARTQQDLDDLQAEISACKAGDGDGDDGEEEEVEERKKGLILRRKDTETLLGQFQALLEGYEDAGPYMDVVLFQDEEGGGYKAVIDLQADGNLTEAVPMAPFGTSRQTGELGFGSAVTFCVQIYDGGKTLSIVTDAGSHGTHVAGIAAAHFGANSTKDGVAPGAQVLACKIGDGRLGSAETGTGLVRALIAAKKYGCDLINLSYGEPSWQMDSGRVAEVFADATHKWGMTVFTSAGNDGPALSSLGSPGALSSPITVGAFVSTDMMVDQYSTLPPLEDGDDSSELRDASYYFSSRGPTPDGAMPDLCAPGGAIAPIPRHTLQGKAQYHGTSMSSPNACGVAAVVLSALKQQGLDRLSPAELRRGLMNTATPVDIADPFAQGTGLISATGAVDYILKHHGKVGQDLSFDVSVPSREGARGIYIRDTLELNGPMTFDVKVLPRFSHASVRTSEEMDELLNLELDLMLDPSEPWVTCPERMSLLSAQERNGQTFSVRLATQDLPPGVHFATIRGIDAADAARGSIFQLPITVVVPHSNVITLDSPHAALNEKEAITLKDNGIDISTTYELLPGAPNRRFLEVPPLAEWATIKIKSSSENPSETSPQRILLHAIPFVRGDLPNTEIQLKRMFQVTEGVEKEFHMKVKGGSTLELCLQLLWLANPAAASVVAEVEFHTLNARAPTLVSSQPLVISAAREFARFGAHASLRSETLNPKASLDTVHRTLRPSTYDIQSGSPDRDIMPPSDAELNAIPELKTTKGTEIYNMFLKYEFTIDAKKAVKVTPCIPSLFRQLYDSPLDSQIWELRDSNSQVLECGSAMHHSGAVSLSKGNYTLTFHTRHPNRQVLEQVKDIPFLLLMSTEKPLQCKIYSELDKASTPSITDDGRKEVGLSILRKGSFKDLYVSRPTGDLPSWVAPGDVMVGKVVLDKGKGKGGVTTMPLVYEIPPKSKVKNLHENKLPNAKEGEKTLEETVFDSKVSYLSTLRGKDTDAYKELSNALLEENPTSISLLSELLLFAKEVKLESDDSDVRVEEIQKVRKLLSVSNGGPIDESALAQYFGVAIPSDDELLQQDKEAAKIKKVMDEQKQLLQATLLALSDATATLSISDASRVDDLDVSVKELKQWAKFSDSKDKDKLTYSLTLSRHLRLCQGASGGAIKILMDARKDTPEFYKELTEELLVIYESLNGTRHAIDHEKDTMYTRYPSKKMAT